MHADEQSKRVVILTAAFNPESGPAGIGAVAEGVSPEAVGSICEQAAGSSDYLHFRAILRALQLAKHLRAVEVRVLCPDERVVKMVNRELPLEPGSYLAPVYMRTRALMYTVPRVEVTSASKFRIAPARRLAIAASRVRRKERQKDLFSAAAD